MMFKLHHLSGNNPEKSFIQKYYDILTKIIAVAKKIITIRFLKNRKIFSANYEKSFDMYFLPNQNPLIRKFFPPIPNPRTLPMQNPKQIIS